MTKKQKKVLIRIIVAAVLMIGFSFLPVSGWLAFGLYMIPYIVIGYDILKKAFKGILNRQVFDENFLMAVATVGAVCLGEYKEGVAVMLFYQIGELFQSYAVGKSRKNISALMDIRPDYANIERDGDIVAVDPDEVAIGENSRRSHPHPPERAPAGHELGKDLSAQEQQESHEDRLHKEIHNLTVESNCLVDGKREQYNHSDIHQVI